jgi:hypothetical protein
VAIILKAATADHGHDHGGFPEPETRARLFCILATFIFARAKIESHNDPNNQTNLGSGKNFGRQLKFNQSIPRVSAI